MNDINETRQNKRVSGTKVPAIIILALLGTACTPAVRDNPDKGWAAPRSLGKSIPTFRPIEKTGNTAQEISARSQIFPLREEPVGVLTLRDALTYTLARNPVLAAYSWEVRAKDARILQAGLIPNPELGAEVENFGGSNEQRNFDDAEATFGISQLIELGGKREKRTRVAKLERDLAGWDYESKRLDVYVATAKAFMATLAAQRRHELQQDQLNLADQVRSTVRERVQAGRASALEDTKAEIQLANAQISSDRARRKLQSTRENLASLWANEMPAFEKVAGSFDSFSTLPPLESLLKLVSQNPAAARLEAEMQLRRSSFDLEKARDIPDLTANAGVRRFESTGDNAFMVGVSIPIPVFGVNPGGVLEAQRRISKAEHEGQATIVSITSALKQAYREGAALYASLTTISKKVLPGANQAFQAAQQGYRQGKFDFLEVLDAQRTLFEARERYLETVAAYHQTTLDIERLTGSALATDISKTSNPQHGVR